MHVLSNTNKVATNIKSPWQASFGNIAGKSWNESLPCLNFGLRFSIFTFVFIWNWVTQYSSLPFLVGTVVVIIFNLYAS